MDKLEKAERLRKCANVTYEEALAALDACDQDLLDAVVMLEKQGRIADPGHGTYSTDYQAQDDYIDVTYRVEQQKQDAPTFSKTLDKIFRTVVRFLKSTSFMITRRETVLFRLPSWVLVIILAACWRVIIPAAIIAMIFGVRYSFEGSKVTDAANSLLSRAGDIADDLRSGLQGEKRREKENGPDSEGQDEIPE